MRWTILILALLLGGCSIFRGPASQKLELPNPSITNVPYSPKDEKPIVKTQDGFQVGAIPTVETPPDPPYEYKIYTGASN